MLKVNFTTQFKRDLKLCERRGYDLSLLNHVVNTLRIPASLPPKNKDHSLVGDYKGNRECHISSDWLLIYQIEENTLSLNRTGTHADLFGK